jgi:hypothetical protein
MRRHLARPLFIAGCQPGTYVDTASGACLPCGQGFYCDGTDRTQCPDGETTATASATLAAECKPTGDTALIIATGDTVCPGAAGVVSFAVTLRAPVAGLTAALVPAADPRGAVPGASCSVTGAGTAWRVACSGVPPGSYAVQLRTMSGSGTAHNGLEPGLAGQDGFAYLVLAS